MINTLASLLKSLPAQVPGVQDSAALAAQEAAAKAAGNPTVTMFVVLAGTAVVMFAIRGLGMLSEKHHPDKVKAPRAPKTSAPAGTPAAAAQASADEESRLAAVIAAAVATVIREPHAIRGFAAVTESPLQSWASEGRKAIYASHKIR